MSKEALHSAALHLTAESAAKPTPLHATISACLGVGPMSKLKAPMRIDPDGYGGYCVNASRPLKHGDHILSSLPYACAPQEPRVENHRIMACALCRKMCKALTSSSSPTDTPLTAETLPTFAFSCSDCSLVYCSSRCRSDHREYHKAIAECSAKRAMNSTRAAIEKAVAIWKQRKGQEEEEEGVGSNPVADDPDVREVLKIVTELAEGAHNGEELVNDLPSDWVYYMLDTPALALARALQTEPQSLSKLHDLVLASSKKEEDVVADDDAEGITLDGPEDDNKPTAPVPPPDPLHRPRPNEVLLQIDRAGRGDPFRSRGRFDDEASAIIPEPTFIDLISLIPNVSATTDSERYSSIVAFTVYQILQSRFPQIFPDLGPLGEKAFVFLTQIDQCNSFAIRVPRDSREAMVATALYPSASFFNHSCYPNVGRTQVGMFLEFVALRDIAEGEPLCISYLGVGENLTQKKRIEKLWATYKFVCFCEACRPPAPSSGTGSASRQTLNSLHEAQGCCRECLSPSLAESAARQFFVPLIVASRQQKPNKQQPKKAAKTKTEMTNPVILKDEPRKFCMLCHM